MISAKRQPIESAQPVAREISGKYVILAVVAVALTGAVASWFYRYSATHRAAQFWGPDAAKLIRDAPQVTLVRLPPSVVIASALLGKSSPAAAQALLDKNTFDMTSARGLIHLRTALLEDRNYLWPQVNDKPIADDHLPDEFWGLNFRDPKTGKAAIISFSEDCRVLSQRTQGADRSGNRRLNCSEQMAKGLREVFDEISASPSEAK
jgi:hypothetical protein